jgi:hypothetical protein
MGNLEKYLKIVKNVVIEPQKDNIEEKILHKIENVTEEDKSILDDNFLDYLKKSNSRFYLFIQKIRNNPGKFTLLGIFAGFFIVFMALILKSNGSKKGLINSDTLPSSKNNSQ